MQNVQHVVVYDPVTYALIQFGGEYLFILLMSCIPAFGVYALISSVFVKFARRNEGAVAVICIVAGAICAYVMYVRIN